MLNLIRTLHKRRRGDGGSQLINSQTTKIKRKYSVQSLHHPNSPHIGLRLTQLTVTDGKQNGWLTLWSVWLSGERGTTFSRYWIKLKKKKWFVVTAVYIQLKETNIPDLQILVLSLFRDPDWRCIAQSSAFATQNSRPRPGIQDSYAFLCLAYQKISSRKIKHKRSDAWGYTDIARHRRKTEAILATCAGFFFRGAMTGQ